MLQDGGLYLWIKLRTVEKSTTNFGGTNSLIKTKFAPNRGFVLSGSFTNNSHPSVYAVCLLTTDHIRTSACHRAVRNSLWCSAMPQRWTPADAIQDYVICSSRIESSNFSLRLVLLAGSLPLNHAQRYRCQAHEQTKKTSSESISQPAPHYYNEHLMWINQAFHGPSKDQYSRESTAES